MTNKKKILFLLQSGVGGAERVTVTISKLLSDSKYEVVYGILDRPLGKQTIEEYLPQNRKRGYIARDGGMRLISNLFKYIKQEKPDIVFSSMMYINTKVLALSLMLPQTKFVIRNNNYLYTLSFAQKLIMQATYPFADKIIAQTDEMKSELVKLPFISEGKVVTLQNPIDKHFIDFKVKEKNPYGQSDTTKYVASGRFFHVKGFDILVKAFREVHDRQPASELFIIGNKEGNCADYYSQIDRLIKELDLAEVVHCIGFQTNPYVYVKYADCFVLSSRNEGLPNVLIEAQYLGTPAAATKCIPVISRIIKEGKTGYLSKVEDSHSLAEAMLKASKLGRIQSEFASAGDEDFISLFEI